MNRFIYSRFPLFLGLLFALPQSIATGQTASSIAQSPTPAVVNRDMVLETGRYQAQGSMHARSSRVVAQQDSRTCMKVVSGPPTPYGGYQSITVSSLALRDGKLLLEATGDEISINSGLERVTPAGTFHFSIGGGRSGVWQLADNKVESSAVMEECLSSRGTYVKTSRGRFIPHRTQPDIGRLLDREDPRAQIDVRTGPGMNYESPHFGRVGDEVTYLDSSRSEDGSENIWYKVKFASSGAEGWIQDTSVEFAPNGR